MVSIGKLMALILAVCLPVLAIASTTEQLQTASLAGNAAFVLVIEPGAAGVDQARQTVQSALSQAPGSVLIESNRADAENSAFIQKYGLASAPVPLVLVFASNGVIAGGDMASRLNSQRLAAMVPSPKKAELLKAVQSGQAVYVTASRPGMATTTDVTKGCAAACAQMMGRGATIEVNMDDPAEKEFLSQLKVNVQSSEPVTVVINAKGQVTGSYTGAVEVENLIASATKVVASGCCPSGSGAGCGPAPKKGGK